MSLQRLAMVMAAMMLLTGCGGGSSTESESTNPPAQPAATETAAATDTSAVPAGPQALAGEYQELVQSIMAAVEKGYQYDAGFEIVTRQGAYVLGGDPESEGFMVSYTIGVVGGNQYQVIKMEEEISDIHEREMLDAGMDAAGTHLQKLMGLLEAYSSGVPYHDSAFHQWEVLEVTMEKAGPATLITVETQLPDSKHDPTVETFTVVDGVLEGFTLSTPYVNQGQLQESTFTYLSKGPIEGASLAALYETVQAQMK